ncbi:MAG: hypothetical protein ACRD19_14745 [Terriglobia bacterium]
MKPNVLYAILLSIGAAGFVAWRVHAVKTNNPTQFEILEDVSGSHGGVCTSLQGLAKQALVSPDASFGSTLTVLVLGDQSTADEPRRIGVYPIPTIRRVAEGRSEFLRQREAILANLRTKCQWLRQTTISPIFLGVAQAVANLRAHGCRADSRCRLFVDSDLEENVEVSMKERLSHPSAKAGSLPPAIDNTGVEVGFCGTAVTAGRIVDPSGRESRKVQPRSAIEEHWMRQTWLKLFTVPETVKFEPYCPIPPTPWTNSVRLLK